MTLGLLNVVSYDQVRNKVIVVPVNDVKAPLVEELSIPLNTIYGQAVAEWEVVIDERFTIDDLDLIKNLDEGESGIAASFPANMREFNRKFKRSRNVDKDAYYLFLVNGVSTSKEGFMPFKRQYGYIFNNTEAQTIAHELGHGAFRLRHTFSPEAFIANQGSTDNLMDYLPAVAGASGSNTKLYKHQWDNVHNPEKMIGWFEGDEESALDICFWTKSVLTYNSLFGKDHVLKPNMPIYNEVKDNFDSYWDQSATLFKKYKFGKDKENNLPLKANSKWTIRNATHYKKTDETFFVDLAVKAIVDRAAGGVTLHKEGVTLARITLEGKDYKLAAYSNEENTKPNYVRVDELCDLVDDENIQIYNADGQSFIAFLNGGVPVLVIQILTDDEDDVETWLKYLGILVEEEGSWMSLVPGFWEDWTWGGGEGDEIGEFNYIVNTDDAWLRQSNSPYDFLTPTEIIDQGAQVSLIDTFKDAKGNDVTKLKLKSDGQIFYTTLTNISEVTKLDKDRNYKLLQNYKALSLPYSQTTGSKTYKKDVIITADKICGNYVKVKGDDIGLEGYWINQFFLQIQDIDLIFSTSELKEKYSKVSETEIKDIFSFIEQYRWEYGVNDCKKLIHFLTQADHESGGFFYKLELEVFTGNREIYKGRGIFQLTHLGNYQEFQDHLKGKGLEVDIVTNPELVENPQYSVLAALWYWKKRNLSNYASQLNLTNLLQISKMVNCGNLSYCGTTTNKQGVKINCNECNPNGWDDRQEKFEKYKDEIDCN